MNSVIIVPYRNRIDHLTAFIAHMSEYYKDTPICVVEQSSSKPFNRAKLLNVGFLENRWYTHFVFHDVDMLPIMGHVNYNFTHPLLGVVQLASSDIQKLDYLGGVTKFSNEWFVRVGGYNNEYYHRAEDNEMMFNLKRLGMMVAIHPQKFSCLPHKREGPEFDPALWRKAKLRRSVQNQLQACNYVVESSRIYDNVKHIIVSL